MSTQLATAAPAGTAGRLTGVRLDRAAIRYVLTVYVSVRVALSLLGLVGVAMLPRNEPADVPGWPADPLQPGWSNAVTAWERWDALWFLRIAAEGYRTDDASAAFFPLYPLLVKGVGFLTGGRWLLAAYVVSNVALIAALLVVHAWTRAELDERAARLTVLLLCVFPTGLFLFAPYSESLFLLLSAGSLLAARTGRWPVAGVLAVAASGTRSIGLLLVLPLVVEAVQQSRGRWRSLPVPLLSALLAPLGAGLYLLWWHLRHGEALRPFSAQGGFGRERDWPWESLVDGVVLGERFLGIYPGGYHTADALLVLAALAGAVWVALRLRPLYGVHVWASLLFPLLLPFGGRPLMSMPRFLVVVVPLFWALAVLSARYRAEQAAVAVSAAGLGVFGVLFVNWYFVF